MRPLICAVALACCGPAMSMAQGPAPAGADLQVDVTAGDLGMPLYPRAWRDASDEDSKPGFNIGLWGQRFGFRLAVLKLRSEDPIETVAAFYRQALATHGPVADCGDPDAAAHDPCDGDRPSTGGHLLKAGVDGDQRIVSIKPADDNVLIQLVRVATGRAAAGR